MRFGHFLLHDIPSKPKLVYEPLGHRVMQPLKDLFLVEPFEILFFLQRRDQFVNPGFENLHQLAQFPFRLHGQQFHQPNFD